MPKPSNDNEFEHHFDLQQKPTALIRPITNPVSNELYTSLLSVSRTHLVTYTNLKHNYIKGAQCFGQFKTEFKNLFYLESLKVQLFSYWCSKLARDQQGVESNQPAIVFWEMVRDDTGVIIGMLWHLFIQNTKQTAGGLLKELIDQANKKMGEALTKGKNRKNNTMAYVTITLEQWRQVSAYVDPVAFNDRVDPFSLDSVINTNDDLCPNQLFSVERVQYVLQEVGAASHYHHHDYSTGMAAAPEDVYQIQAGALSPMQIYTYLFPHLEVKNHSSEAERQHWMAMHGTTHSPAMLREIFDSGLTSHAVVAGEKTFEQLGQLVQKMSSKVVDIMANEDLTLAAKERQCKKLQAQIDAVAMKEFEAVLSPLGDRGDAPIAISKWLEEFLITHKNLCMPRKKIYKNQSRLASWITEVLACLETIKGINVTHSEILFYYLSCFTAHRGAGFRLHHLGKQQTPLS
jgi:hypothetical protein